VTTPIGVLAGQRQDPKTGLHYNYHRYYDPAIGRYLTTDPIGLEGGINPYVYVQNNPVNFVDPYGLFEIALTPYAVAAAPAIALADSPFLPFGYALAGAIIGLSYLHDTWSDDMPAQLNEINDSGDSCDIEIKEERIKRKKPGRDGAESEHILEKQNNETISKTHRVTKDGKVIHQHKDYVGKYGTHRRFPNKWTR